MSVRIASFLILASAVVLSYVTFWAGKMVPFLFMPLFSVKSLDEARTLMPRITRLAADHSWAFAVVIALICLAAIGCLRRMPDKASQLFVGALSGVGIVAWTAMFCYCYMGFTGPSCLHHEPGFDFINFALFGAGVFPVTLAIISALGFYAFFPRSRGQP